MDKYESLEQQRSMRFFTFWVLLSQLLGIMAVIMVAVWMGHYRGGFAWQSDPNKEFNYHPLFMVLGMIFLYGDAILVYRVFRNDRKIIIKIVHASLLILALVFATVGLKAVFDSHNLASPPKPNLYTLHSWIGLTAVILFALQWVCGFLSFLLPGVNMALRGVYKPIHVYMGFGIFIMAVAAALSGMTEKAIWAVKNYSTKPPEGILVNCLGLTVIAFAFVVGYIISNPNFKRQPLPEEETIQLAQ